MNVTLRRALAACVLAGSLALALALAAGTGPADAQTSIVGPGESIQKAIYAADPGDTIVVKGMHREDVVIHKDGIKLRGEDAVIEPPAKADSPCAPEAICIKGDMNFQTGEITGPRVSDVSVSGFTIRDFQEAFAIDVLHARNATVTGNRVVGNTGGGIGVTSLSINTTIAKNHVIGSPETHAGIAVELSSNTTIAKNLVRNIPVGKNAIAVDHGSTNTTVEGNDLVGNWVGAFIGDSPGTKVLSNDISRSGFVGTFVGGQKSANAKLVGNHISGGPWGIFVTDTRQGSLVGNDVRDNCAGIWFEAFGPVGGFKVTGNTVTDNTRSCQGQKFGRKFSGIGIALLGASRMEVSTNHLWGNVPSGPTPISGGVVVATDPNFGVTAKPNNNTVSANHFGRNKPDIFWDKSGTGNRFVANLCDTSVPSSLCN
jgi:parallel beta-helix repeat protein